MTFKTLNSKQLEGLQRFINIDDLTASQQGDVNRYGEIKNAISEDIRLTEGQIKWLYDRLRWTQMFDVYSEDYSIRNSIMAELLSDYCVEFFGPEEEADI